MSSREQEGSGLRLPETLHQQLILLAEKELGQASSTEIKSVLDKREMIQPEEELSPEIVARFQQRIHDASKA